MEKYENLGLVGEGSYGMVMKCRNKENGRIVAVKKFLESDDDKTVKKIALREIKMLKQLRHENLVNLLEVCKKKRRWYLVFEFVDRTVLDDLEQYPNGLDCNRVRKYLFQILRAIKFCHQHNIIHRDIKPENILVSQCGVVKLCDFGFARTMAAPGEVYTDYVATRWYRAPELLVGDIKYGKPVDVWAIGCLFMEMLTGDPLFPGDSDIDQLYHIMRCFGNLTPRHQELFYKNPVFAGVSLPEITEKEPLEKRFPKLPAPVSDLTKKCLQIDPDKRPSCSDLLQHEFFIKDGFLMRFTQELNSKIQKDIQDNPSFPKMSKTSKKDTDDFSLDEKVVTRRDSTVNVKAKEGKHEVKAPKLSESKMEYEKAETLAKNRPENPEKTPDGGLNPGKAPLGKDISEHLKTAAVSMIPPISHNPLAIITNGLNLGAGVGPPPGPLGLRAIDKVKKPANILNRMPQQSSNYFNGNISGKVASEKSVFHERSFLSDRTGNGGKKERKERGENLKADIHFPELKTSLLPELRGAEGKQSKMTKKEHKKDCRIPSINAIDVYSNGAL